MGALIAALIGAATITGADAAGEGSAPRAKPAQHTCFWEGPISMKRPSSRGFDGHYFNFPEESATYWLSRFHLPEGAEMVLRGRYPHSRYMSLNSYSEAVPTDALSDIAIRPNRHSVNPFRPGNRRDRPRRDWRVRILDSQPPAAGERRAPNTLYARPAGDAAIEIAYRVYEADRGLDLTGATGLPKPVIKLADGRILRDRAVCAAVNDPDRSITVDTTPEALWKGARATPGCDPATNPAYDPVRWERFFTYEFGALGVVTDCTEAGRDTRQAATPAPAGGNYSNKDSAYIYAHLSRKHGPVLVVRGKMPRTPRTYGGQRRMGRGQMRYWSLCSGESRVTTRTPDCVWDRIVPLDATRRYTIVVSRREDRPANARRRCGVAWLNWGERGDGVGDRDYGLLIMRNMLVSPRFRHAIQRVTQAGTEPEVMGPFFPRAAYTSRDQFEARGCR